MSREPAPQHPHLALGPEQKLVLVHVADGVGCPAGENQQRPQRGPGGLRRVWAAGAEVHAGPTNGGAALVQGDAGEDGYKSPCLSARSWNRGTAQAGKELERSLVQL